MSTFAMQKKIYENSLELIRRDNATVKECLRSLKKPPKGSLIKKHIRSNGDSSSNRRAKNTGNNGKKQRKLSAPNDPKNNAPNILKNAIVEKSCPKIASTTTKSNAGTVVYSRPAHVANSRPAVIANSPGHRSPTVRQQLLNQQQQQLLQQKVPPQQRPTAKKLFSSHHQPQKPPRDWDVLSIDPDSVDSEFDIYQRAENIAEIREKHLDLKRMRVSELVEAQHEDGGGFYRGEDFDNWSDED